MEESRETIPNSIMAYINEIAERMRQGRAAVMVGCGFSKNANPKRYTEKKFLDWGELGNIFYKKLYGKYPWEEEKAYFYNDVMKLAERVEECFGRTVLDKLIIDNLPDEEYEPSEIHEMLLRLNWTDIFTTNYDTLLERTREKVFYKRYELIVSKDDLVFSKNPRIIKLHGSFPSIRPFVVTEEDYRKYPKESAIFVNTVQQSLIENTMCMIGFSGEDPNFLKWIGWIRDSLGKNIASKIYLIGVFKEQEIERKLYHSRNVVLVNMKECLGIEEGDHNKGLKLFFEKLLELQSEKENKIWEEFNDISVQSLISAIENKQLQISIKKVTDEWRKERESYPGWLIVPYDRRVHLESSVKSIGVILHTIYDFLEENAYEKIGDFLYEFEWRRYNSLVTQKYEWILLYEKYIQKKSLNSHIRMYLGLAILEFYRLSGNSEKWLEYEKILEREIRGGEYEQKFCLEKAYQKLYRLEFGALTRILVQLPQCDLTSNSVFLYSAIFVEMGHYDEAVEYLMRNLNEMRRQMGDTIDYQKYSYEANYISLLDYIEKYEYYRHSYHNLAQSQMQDYAHYRTLRGYECDLQYESDYLMNSIITKCNTIGMYKLIEKVDAQQYMNFIEIIGMTFRANYLVRHVDKIPRIIQGMLYENPYRAFICTVRFSDVKSAKEIWNYKECAGIKSEHAERIADVCLRTCEQNKEYILDAITHNYNSLPMGLPEILPVILSGIVDKLCSETKHKILRFIRFGLEYSEMGFKNLKTLLRNTIKSLNKDELGEYWDDFFSFPLGEVEKDGESLEMLLEPVIYIDVANVMTSKENAICEFKIEDWEKEYTSESEKDALFLRKLLFSILTQNKDMASKAAVELGNSFNKKDYVDKLYCYYLYNFGDTLELEKVKESFISRLDKRINKLKSYENLKCIELFSDLEDMRDELNYYYSNSHNLISWDEKILEEYLNVITQWKEYVKIFIENGMYSEFCGLNWMILEEILLILLIHEKDKGCVVKRMQRLDKDLQQINIPFALQKFYQKNMQLDLDIANFFICQIMKGNAEKEEIIMIIRNLKKFYDLEDEKFNGFFSIINLAFSTDYF